MLAMPLNTSSKLDNKGIALRLWRPDTFPGTGPANAHGHGYASSTMGQLEKVTTVARGRAPLHVPALAAASCLGTGRQWRRWLKSGHYRQWLQTNRTSPVRKNAILEAMEALVGPRD